MCMYKLRPLVSHDEPLPAPSHNMYRMKPADQALGASGMPTVSTGNMAVLEERQEEILKKLAKLKIDIGELRAILRQPSPTTVPSSSAVNASCVPCPALGESYDAVIYASPEHPPFSILGLAHLWGEACPMLLTSHTHSSVKEPPASANIFSNTVFGTPCLRVTLVWKDVGAETELVINPVRHTTIRGEANILRFLSRVGPRNLSYENGSDLNSITLLDEVLDNCQRLARTRTVKEKQALIRTLNASLGKSEWMCGQPSISVVDIAVWSVIKQSGQLASLTQALAKWMERCDAMLL